MVVQLKPRTMAFKGNSIVKLKCGARNGLQPSITSHCIVIKQNTCPMYQSSKLSDHHFNLKNRLALLSTKVTKSSSDTPLCSAINFATQATYRGSLGRTLRCGAGVRYGESVSIIMRSAGMRLAASARYGALLKVVMPVKLIIAPNSKI